MEKVAYPIVPLLQAYYWFDESLQNYIAHRGWPTLSRSQSMVMMNVCQDIVRPSDIARNLGLTRQAVHTTISQLIDLGMFKLEDDPHDGRTKIVVLTKMGASMRQDARTAMGVLTDELKRRIGAQHVNALLKALAEDWGPPAATFTQQAARRKTR